RTAELKCSNQYPASLLECQRSFSRVLLFSSFRRVSGENRLILMVSTEEQVSTTPWTKQKRS
ncbi:uncharacterized protein H6S33_010866, partial [Morchella sextelata]|uniref:uncharacterized protein n=1 Tax=Morchella sextelata TaxID=1174677 RepID=UPI001D050514